MTPKEKAQEIVDEFNTPMVGTVYAKINSITCAEILIKETSEKEYWKEVKIEIEKLSAFGDLKIDKLV